MSETILIVEDNPDNSILLEHILKHNNYSYKSVDTGQGCLDFCKNEVPALILLDMSLPDIEGLIVARKLRLEASTQQVPIIAVTAHDLASMEDEVLKSGCNAYISKPYTPEAIVAEIKKWVD